MTTHDGTAAAAAATATAAAAQTTHPTAMMAVDGTEPSPSERPADAGDAAVAATPTPAADVQPVAADGEVTATAVDEDVQRTPEADEKLQATDEKLQATDETATEPSPVTKQNIATEVSVLKGDEQFYFRDWYRTE